MNSFIVPVGSITDKDIEALEQEGIKDEDVIMVGELKPKPKPGSKPKPKPRPRPY